MIKMLFTHILRISLVTSLILLLILLITGCTIFGTNIPGKMPGTSFDGSVNALTPAELSIKSDLFNHIDYLSETIGPRHMEDGSLYRAAEYIKSEFSKMGYQTTTQDYKVDNKIARNIIAELKGTEDADKIIIIGGHYDTGANTKGANDNASGIAATLALAKIFSNKHQKYTIRFVAFANEEPPYFHSETMGSLVYARQLKADNENIIAMLSLETMGYYSNEKGSQKYPPPLNWFYPDTGNFIGFVSNLNSEDLLYRAITSFRKNSEMPSEGGIIADFVPGVGWSDHWSFWQVDYPAIMVTDTAVFRYPHYHRSTDTIDKIDFDSLTRVVSGLEKVVENLANK